MSTRLKIIAINVLILFVLYNAVIWIIYGAHTLTHIRNRLTAGSQSIATAERMASLPNYAKVSWAKTHFSEWQSLSTNYVSFIGWRRKLFSGQTINISGSYHQRRTVGNPDPEKPTVYFFGGSTMWGTGADDASTIPSLFMQISGFAAENFGETAYTAHQSLIMLMQLLEDGRRPDIVVFYDGANDANKCRSELTPWSDLHEADIQSALDLRASERTGLSNLLRPLQHVAQRTASLLPGSTKLDCHSNSVKAQRIANNLVADWTVAKELVESYKGKFVGILQPVRHFSHTRDLADSNPWGQEWANPNAWDPGYEAIYPLIKKQIINKHGFYDLTGVLNRDEYIYIDWCHLSPNGNRYMAEEIFKIMRDTPG
jgi:lysophospholipase L1-like esterase